MSPPRWSRRGATASCRRRSWRAWNECGPSVVVPGFGRRRAASRALSTASNRSISPTSRRHARGRHAVDTECEPNDEQSDRGLEEHLASDAQPGRSTKRPPSCKVVRARCPSDQSAGGVESRAGTARRGSAPVIAPASSRAAARTGRSVGTTHARRASGPLTGPAQIESSWSRDHEDGGPTIQLPAAEFRCTLRSPELRSVYRAKWPAIIEPGWTYAFDPESL